MQMQMQYQYASGHPQMWIGARTNLLLFKTGGVYPGRTGRKTGYFADSLFQRLNEALAADRRS